MLSLTACRRFWSSLSMVNFVNLWIPFGKYSRRFCDRWRSVRFSSPLISSGISSNRFSETSRQTRFLRFPISTGNLWSWLWSSQSSWSDGKLPRCGGSSSISLSPKSNRSSFVSLLMDSGRCFNKFSRNSSDSNWIKLLNRENIIRFKVHSEADRKRSIACNHLHDIPTIAQFNCKFALKEDFFWACRMQRSSCGKFAVKSVFLGFTAGVSITAINLFSRFGVCSG